jgi:hypothetical protein
MEVGNGSGRAPIGVQPVKVSVAAHLHPFRVSAC